MRWYDYDRVHKQVITNTWNAIEEVGHVATKDMADDFHYDNRESSSECYHQRHDRQ